MLDPVALKIGPLSIHWYGLLYLVGLAMSYAIVSRLNPRARAFRDNEQILDFAFYFFLFGVIAGGRLGYVFFYDLPSFIHAPLKIFALWEGGLSFHGGLIGSALATLWYCRKHRLDFWAVADLLVIPVSLAQGIGRWGNFINRELLGRPIENPFWDFLGVDFGDGVLRYPSQIFQSAEGVLTFAILLFLFSKHPPKKTLLFVYLILNGALRIVTEFWRLPDPQVGYLFGILTLGQMLGFLVFALGIAGLIWIRHRPPERKT